MVGHGVGGSLDQAAVVTQTQIVVSAEVQHLVVGLHLDIGALRRGDDTFVLVQTGSLDVGELLLEMFLKFSKHDKKLILLKV